MAVEELIEDLNAMPKDAYVEINISDGGPQCTVEPNYIHYETNIKTVIIDYV